MELRHLRYFKVVAEALNFTKAATRLHVAQPALSRQIADLEYELGVDLLKRNSHGVTLTPEGKLFLEEVKEILNRTEDAIKKVRAQARGESSELHVGYLPPLELRILPRALAEFKVSAPNVKVVLHDLGSDEIGSGLREGALQLALMLQPSEQARNGIVFEEIGRFTFFVAMAPSHPLARMKKVSLDSLIDQPLVVMGKKRNSEYHRTLFKIFASRRPNISIESDSINSLITEVESGNAVAVVSEVFKVAVGRRLTYRPLETAVGRRSARGRGDEACLEIKAELLLGGHRRQDDPSACAACDGRAGRGCRHGSCRQPLGLCFKAC
jgi:DNA-binding transcriptional LysR family regulator